MLSVNGRELEDFLDWEFLSADDHLLVAARMPDGAMVEYDVERPEGVPMGVELEPPSIRRCANRCDFCFVDGLPEGLRETLYIRDDDYRLSFRHGNFATLTNLKQKDVDRIVEYHLSPLYVSVHTTDHSVRKRLLRNPLAPNVMDQLRFFARHDIQVHSQLVLQPGLNDGEVLDASIEDLWGLGDTVLSVSVVPVGLTEFSKLGLVREPTAAECAASIATVARWQSRALEERGRRWIYGSDDLFLNAGAELPPAETYDGFEQLENGVGSVRFLLDRIAHLDGTEGWHDKRIVVLTGTGMGRHMPVLLEALDRATGAAFELRVLENELFGATVTTAALLPGRSFALALEDAEDFDLALLPAESVNDDMIFMDDIGFDEVARVAGCEVRLSYDFADVLHDGSGDGPTGAPSDGVVQ